MALRLSSLLTRRSLVTTLQLRSKTTIQGESESLGSYDVVIVGGGIVGTATARELKLRNPELSCALLEKEETLAAHQSGHNSGVIHAGIYYTPGSLKAKLCLEGLRLAYEYAEKNNIPHKRCGKLIVATNAEEAQRLDGLFKRGLENNVPDLKIIEGPDIAKLEPAVTGVRAILSPHTGIIDWGYMTNCYGEDFKKAGGDIYLGFEVNGFNMASESGQGSSDINKYPVKINSKNGKTIGASFVLTCAGLHSGKVAALSGGSPVPAIIPFRGEYLKLTDEKKDICQALIYPVPDPRFPFLGIHVTPTIHGDILIGPNAVLALKREGYKTTDFSISDIVDYASFKGFRKLAMKHTMYGINEWLNSVMISRQIKYVQKLVPSITAKDLSSGWAGVRAQAVSADGALVDDFVFDSGSGPAGKLVLHCRNAPSPAATSSLAIAKVLSDRVLKQMASTG